MVALLLAYILEEEMGLLLCASHPRSHWPQQPLVEDGQHWSLFLLFDKALQDWPRALSSALSLLPSMDLSISLQAPAMTRVPQLLHAAPSL